jgi:hypothetical protein
VSAVASEPGTFLKWLITHGVVLTNWEGDALGFCPCDGTLGKLLAEYEQAAAEPYDASRDINLPLSRVIEMHVPRPEDAEAGRCVEQRARARSGS